MFMVYSNFNFFSVQMLEFSQKTLVLQNELEDQLNDLRSEHEDELRRLQEELDILKSKVHLNCFIN